jgi:hypothetical protein
LGFGAKADPDTDVSALEVEIAEIVYSLCGLTREEIAIIEESQQEKPVPRWELQRCWRSVPRCSEGA